MIRRLFTLTASASSATLSPVPVVSSSSLINGNLKRRMSKVSQTFYDFKAHSILGQEELDFSQFKDKVVIVVNAASYCGLTKSNYSGLSELLDRYYDRGLRVLMFPCNQFANQERDSAEIIKAFAEKYDTRFILAEKVQVNGSDAHPLFQWLKDKCPGFLVDAIKWNFTKFVIDKTGNPVARFAPTDEPKSMTSKIEELL